MPAEVEFSGRGGYGKVVLSGPYGAGTSDPFVGIDVHNGSNDAVVNVNATEARELAAKILEMAGPAPAAIKVGDRVRLVHDDEGYVDHGVGTLGTIVSELDEDDDYRVRFDGDVHPWYVKVDQLAPAGPEPLATAPAVETVPELVARIQESRKVAANLGQTSLVEGLGAILAMLSMFGVKGD